jgi:hypothetical protein
MFSPRWRISPTATFRIDRQHGAIHDFLALGIEFATIIHAAILALIPH